MFLNTCVVVGRITKIEPLNQMCIVTVKVRDKLSDNSREYTVKVRIYNKSAKAVEDKCKPLDMIGIKGYLDTIDDNLVCIASQVSVYDIPGQDVSFESDSNNIFKHQIH